MQHYHYKLYKPCGILCQFSSNDIKQAKRKRFLSSLGEFPEGIMPVGRLDEKSEGLLLLTTDGKLCDTINRSGVEKEYYAQLDGEITVAALVNLMQGVTIGVQGKKYVAKPRFIAKIKAPTTLPDACSALRIGRHRPTSWITLVLTEGKYRHVRKMTAAIGYPTLRLVRVRIGEITLDGLTEGKCISMGSLL
nr:pseudouridine synthase [Costertonia aggregata]